MQSKHRNGHRRPSEAHENTKTCPFSTLFIKSANNNCGYIASEPWELSHHLYWFCYSIHRVFYRQKELGREWDKVRSSGRAKTPLQINSSTYAMAFIVLWVDEVPSSNAKDFSIFSNKWHELLEWGNGAGNWRLGNVLEMNGSDSSLTSCLKLTQVFRGRKVRRAYWLIKLYFEMW